MKIEIIIPTYNNYDLVKKNLPLVVDSISSFENLSVVIVDDGSKEYEQDKLKVFIGNFKKKSKAKVRLMLFSKNVGFSSNVNRAALDSESDIIVLLNSDVYPESNFLKPLLSHFEDDKILGVAMMDKSLEGKREVLRGRGVTYWRRGMFFHRKGEVDKSSTSWISGGSCIIRTSIFKKIGGFDSLYNPFYWEDIDLSYVGRKMGYKILFESKCKVVHSHLEGSIKKNFTDKKIKIISSRNQLIFIWKNITDPMLIISHIFFLPFYIIQSIVSLDFTFMKGFLLAVSLLPDIIGHRAKLKEMFVLQDKDIIP